MTRILITGGGGFVARFLLELYDITAAETTDILALDRHIPEAGFRPLRCPCRFETIDLLDTQAVAEVIAAFQPDRLIHLAAVSSVAASWQAPAEAVSNNLAGLLNVLEGIRNARHPCRVLSVGSSEVYEIPEHEIPPVDEQTPLRPGNPYAVARLAQEQLVRLYVETYGLDIVSTRSFNHTGPGQNERFAVPSFLRQLLQAKQAGRSRAVLTTGDIDLIRDYSDVRDVVQAYDRLLSHGKNGGIYNVCRGDGLSLRSVILKAAKILDLEVETEIDPARLRPNEPRVLIGNGTKLRRETGWLPKFSIDQTLGDMLRRMR